MTTCRRVLIFCPAALVVAAAASAQRTRYSLDSGGRFALGDAAGADRPAFNDSQWRVLDLPHYLRAHARA